MYGLDGVGPAIKFFTYNVNQETMLRALTERVFFHQVDGHWEAPHRPTRKFVLDKLRTFTKRLIRRLPDQTPVSLDKIPAMYSGHKRQVYERAVESLHSRPVEERDSFLKTFIKFEKNNGTAKKHPCPRVIQPRDPRYLAALIAYLKLLEHPMYQSINHVFRSEVITKGKNSSQTAACIVDAVQAVSGDSWVGIGLDASRFDQHESEAVLWWEHQIYMACFKDREDRAQLKQLLEWQRVNYGFARTPDALFRYRVHGGRMSGDINTAMGNCLVMCAMAFSFMHDQGFDIKDYRFVDNGDDCILFVRERDLSRVLDNYKAWFSDMGFPMKIEFIAREIEQVCFCQSHPVYDGESWRMVRNYPDHIAKDCVSTTPLLDENQRRAWLKSVSECGIATTGGIPIAQNFYRWLYRGEPEFRSRHKRGHHRKYATPVLEQDTGLYLSSVGMHESFREPSVEARLSYWRAFGVSCTDQKIVEAFYDTKLKYSTRMRVARTARAANAYFFA